MAVLDAASLAQLMNSYALEHSPSRVVIPQISQLATLRDVTVTGTLIHKRLTHIQRDGTRTESIPSHGQGLYVLEQDGDVHFCLGTVDDDVHVPCELQHATDWIDTFNGAIGNQITVTGFFRCLFEHPGFHRNDDAHVFEIHPVRAVDFGDGSGFLNIDVNRPDADSIRTWLSPHDLNQADSAVEVTYDPSSDTATFSNIGDGNENYVEEVGQISEIDLSVGTPEPSTFRFDGDNINRQLKCYCLKNTIAARQLEPLANGARVTLLGLRNIDLSSAMLGQYVINLLAIDIQPQ